MIKNYLKIAWRNFLQNKSYSFINVIGLSVGLCCLFLILLFVTDELSYDQFHPDHEQIYSVAETSVYGGEEHTSLSNFFPAGPAMVAEIPEVESFVNTTYPGDGDVSKDGLEFSREDKLIAATSEFFTFFNFPLLQGNAEQVLGSPGKAVITEELANRLYPEESAVGKTIIIDKYGKHEYQITGVAQNPPQNSYLTFDAIFSMEGLSHYTSNRNSWSSSMYNTFVKLNEAASWKDIESKVDDIVKTHRGEQADESFVPIPIAELYLSDVVNVDGFKGNYTYIYLFLAIGIFIILLASINYMNLATARGMQRAKEIGVRKVMGADKKQLIQQFLGESVLTTLASFVFAFFLVELATPAFNMFFDKQIDFSPASYGLFVGSLFLLSIFVGLVSGAYPALFLSRFQPSGILKNNFKFSGSLITRKTLIVFQFFISSVLLIGTLVIFNQLKYMQNKDLGFDKEQVMYIPFASKDLVGKMEVFKQSVESHQAAIAVSSATGIPGRFWFSRTLTLESGREISAHFIEADQNYPDVLGFELLAGRFVNPELASDVKSGVVINQRLVKELGFVSPDDVIGKQLPNGKYITGVINDFHFQSLKEQISPVIIEAFSNKPGTFGGGDLLAVRFQNESLRELMSYLSAEWKNQVSDEPITVQFLDQELRKYYETESKLAGGFSFFAGVCIIIACLGLFGLAAFTSQLRIKEIGIRKVLGATVASIVALISKDFVKLVGIGFLLAVPVAFYAMSSWLNEFAYTINLGPNLFIFAGLIAVIIALVTVGWQSIKAAMANPVESLRSE